MYAVIGVAVVIDLGNDNVFIYNDEPRDSMKSDNVSYDGFEKDLDVDEVVDCKFSETDADMYYQYIGAELHITNKDGMKRMARSRKILCNDNGNTEGTGNYRAWVDHTE